jgi:transposase
MEQCSTIIGLDVHKETITAAILPPGAEQVLETLKIPNTPRTIASLVHRLAPRGPLAFVYEAGPCGYEVHRQLTALGQPCAVIAPALTPRRPGDRVKTDRRDAEKLARWYRAGELVVIHVPSRAEEAARDLVRVREDAVEDRLRARHRLSKFLRRQGRVDRETKAWGVTHRQWLTGQRFAWAALQQTVDASRRTLDETDARLAALDQARQDLAQQAAYRPAVAALRCLKGVNTLTALTLVVETQDFRRFPTAAAFMSFTGLVPSEDRSGARVRRGRITKSGTAHLRRVLGEAAWCHRHGPSVSRELAARRQDAPRAVRQLARKAQARLHRRYWRLLQRGKLHTVAVTAVARELAGFVWAIGQHIGVTTTG